MKLINKQVKGINALTAVLFLGLMPVSTSIYAADCTYGRNTCKPGYVWREATPGDYVCVTPQTRNDTHYENAQYAYRVKDIGSPDGYCKQGYVWREAYPGDKACVTPASRDRAKQDNQQAAARKSCPYDVQ